MRNDEERDASSLNAKVIGRMSLLSINSLNLDDYKDAYMYIELSRDKSN